uniref:NPHP1 n=1 Tax=Schmidtea mediterranea TaxID=79327 RepID=A0A0H3YFE3_SCHMD|nr:NPHP1 [Schmidtea mediterranea]
MEKLSEIITENEEIISDVNDLIKESKNYKKLDKESLDKNIKKCQNLLLDVDDIIEVILACKKPPTISENDPTLATFDSDKKSSHAKALKAKKVLEDNMSNLEKFYKKNFEDSIPKEQPDLEKSKKSPSNPIEKSGDLHTEVGKSISKPLDNNQEEKSSKEKTKKKSENKKNKKSKKDNKEEKEENVDKEESVDKDEKIKSSEEIEASSTKNSQKSTKKGILKSSFKSKDKGKNKNKQDDENEIQEDPINVEHKDNGKGLNDDPNLNKVSVVSKDLNITNKNHDEIEKSEKQELNENISPIESEQEDNEINMNSKLNEIQKEKNSSKKNKKLTKSKKEKVSKVKTSKEDKTKLKESESKDSDKNLSTGDLSIKKEKSKSLSKNNSDISENKNEAEEKEIDVIESHMSSLSNEASETTIQSQFSSKVRSYNDEEDLAGQNMLQIGKKYVLAKTFSSEEEDDLSGIEGEEILLLEIMEGDWSYVKNNRGETGYVPTSYLKVKLNAPTPKIEEILVPKHNEDENEKGLDTLKEGNMPESELGTKIEDSSDSWIQIKQSMHEKTINDILKECGNLPSGFRYSTIFNWSKENSNNSSFIAFLCPKLSDSHLNFSELQADQANSQQKIQRQLQLIKLNKFPFISEKFIIKSRHVRLCLFNGNKVLSNIHLIRATVSGKNLTTWNFNLKVSEDMKSVEFGEVFIKFNQSSTDLSILMEFCIQGYKSKLDTVANADTLKTIDEDFTNDELLEFSIGWTSIPLYESNGQPIITKKGDYVLNGGTPFEKGIEVDPLNKNDSSGKPKFMLNQNKQPYVTIRLSVPSKENKELIDTLPSMIVGSTLHLVLLSFYRKLLTESILDLGRNLTSTKSIYSPFLVSFTQVAECPLLLDTLRNIWNEKLKTTKDLNKKDQVKMNEFFQKIYMDFIYPLTKLKDFQNYNLSKENLLQNEERKLSEIIQKMKLDMTSILVTDEHSFVPLQFAELDFNIMSRYGKHK